jgi:hypothetical protein
MQQQVVRAIPAPSAQQPQRRDGEVAMRPAADEAGKPGDPATPMATAVPWQAKIARWSSLHECRRRRSSCFLD